MLLPVFHKVEGELYDHAVLGHHRKCRVAGILPRLPQVWQFRPLTRERMALRLRELQPRKLVARGKGEWVDAVSGDRVDLRAARQRGRLRPDEFRDDQEVVACLGFAPAVILRRHHGHRITDSNVPTQFPQSKISGQAPSAPATGSAPSPSVGRSAVAPTTSSTRRRPQLSSRRCPPGRPKVL